MSSALPPSSEVMAPYVLTAGSLTEQHRVQDLLGAFAYALRTLDDLHKVIELVPLMVTRLTDTHAALVVFWQEGTQKARVAQFCRKGDTSEQAILEAAVILEQTNPTEVRQLQECFSPTLPCHSAPILIRNQVRGHLCVFTKEGEAAWGDSREKLLRLIADLTALAVMALEPDHRRSPSLEQRKVQDLLSALGYALRSFANLNQLLELLPLMACRVTDAQAGIIALIQNDRIRLEEFDSRQYLPFELEHLQRALATCASEGLDVCLRAQLPPEVQLFSTPILVKSTIRGYLWVLTTDPEYVWSDAHQKLLRLIADQTAVAVENEELTVQLRRQEMLAREVDIGSEIQERLLPKTHPDIPGLAVAARCENASKVGGDYYDFIPILDTGRWGLVLGDVMGKGVPAGLIMMMTRSTLRSEALREEAPDQILTHLNRVMYADLEKSSRFVTLFYAEYDPSTHRLTYTNAAHPRPLWWRARTAEFCSLELAGTLIGLNPDTPYLQATLDFEPGDILVCYTDGFTEAMGSKERFGDENWTEQVHHACSQFTTPEEILDYLYAQIHEFCGGPSGDDMTMMVLQAQ